MQLLHRALLTSDYTIFVDDRPYFSPSDNRPYNQCQYMNTNFIDTLINLIYQLLFPANILDMEHSKAVFS